ncbi:hypothetical protein AK973_2304 [Pseudomonas brassicacearum]|nr:hypothetical protein AK973_2304 [Pseudomonas brassicacearum]
MLLQHVGATSYDAAEFGAQSLTNRTGKKPEPHAFQANTKNWYDMCKRLRNRSYPADRWLFFNHGTRASARTNKDFPCTALPGVALHPAYWQPPCY